MAAKVKTIKAGALAVPAFLILGCESALPDEAQPALWFLGHAEFVGPLLVLILGPTLYWIIKKIGRPRSIPALWIYGGVAFTLLGGYTLYHLTGDIDSIGSRFDPRKTFLNWLIVPVASFGIGAILFAILPKAIRAAYNFWLALTTWALWLTGLCLMVLPEFYLFFLIAPRRYVDNQAQYKFLDALTLTGAILCMASLATFVILLIEALVVRRPMPHKAADPKLKAFE